MNMFANLFLIGQMLQDLFNQLDLHYKVYFVFQLYIRSSQSVDPQPPQWIPKLNLRGHKMAHTKLFVFACSILAHFVFSRLFLNCSNIMSSLGGHKPTG